MSKKFENLSGNNRNLPRGINSLFKPAPLENAVDILQQQNTGFENNRATDEPIVEKPVNYVRHTVMFLPEDLEFLKNMVYSEKLRGNVNYSQKEALHEAIELLRREKEEIIIRPENIVAYEKHRAESISRGRNLK
jgi:hypothetical protein